MVRLLSKLVTGFHVTRVFQTVLILCGLCHIVAHFVVLTGLYSIGHLPNTTRRVYFAFDLLVSICAWLLTQRNTLMVVFHGLIHMGAVSHLFLVLPTKFYSQIFAMGELDFNDKQVPVIVFYVWATTQDICNHMLNCYFLYHANKTLHKKIKLL